MPSNRKGGTGLVVKILCGDLVRIITKSKDVTLLKVEIVVSVKITENGH